MTLTILHLVLAFVIGYICAYILEPKPVDAYTASLLIGQAIGSMIAAYLGGAIATLIIMIFSTSVRKKYWEYSTGIMLGIIAMYTLVELTYDYVMAL